MEYSKSRLSFATLSDAVTMFCNFKPMGFEQGDYLEVSAFDKELELQLRNLQKNGISKKTIDFVRDAINNAPNEITKKNIVDNLQRYAEICGSLLKDIHTFKVIKGQFQTKSKLNDDILGFIQAQLSAPPIVDNRKQIQNAAYAILVHKQLSNDGIKAPLKVITHILDYVEQHQNQTDHVGVIMDNLGWYALAYIYCERTDKDELFDKMRITVIVGLNMNFESKFLLSCKDYKQFASLSFSQVVNNTVNGGTRYKNIINWKSLGYDAPRISSDDSAHSFFSLWHTYFIDSLL